MKAFKCSECGKAGDHYVDESESGYSLLCACGHYPSGIAHMNGQEVLFVKNRDTITYEKLLSESGYAPDIFPIRVDVKIDR